MPSPRICPQATPSYPGRRIGDPPPALPQASARRLGIVAAVVVMALVVGGGLSALEAQARPGIEPARGTRPGGSTRAPGDGVM
jgi:hypothetical protein